MTITEKILSAHCGRKEVYPGEIIEVKTDVVVANELSCILAIEELEKAEIETIFDRTKIFLMPSHFSPNKDIQTAELTKRVREFAYKYKIEHYLEVGRMGIEHVVLPERGWVLPGDIVIGGDSHTCMNGALGCFATGVGSTDVACAFALGEVWLKVPSSIKVVFFGKLNKWVYGKDLILFLIGKIGVEGARYNALEFTGETLKHLSMSERLTITNMTIEAGGKNGIMEPDEITISFIKSRNPVREWKIYRSDSNALYEKVIEINCSEIEPQVAFPSLPENTRSISQVGNIDIDQVFIGSCTNGKLEDLRIAAGVLKGRKVHKRVRVIVTPATQEVYLQAVREGLIEIFIEAECAVTTPSCGACLGGHMGVLASGERCLSTTNRNFIGRMGSPKAEIYLSNPAIAAASAVTGKISSPFELD